MRDPELEEDCPGLIQSPYTLTSPPDPAYNCVAWAMGDDKNWWEDGVPTRGYYWPDGADSDTIDGWVKAFAQFNYVETLDRSLEPDYEKVAIYGRGNVPEHVARQKGSGAWTSKMGRGRDFEHTLEAIEGSFNGVVVKILKRKCQGGRRVRE